MKSTILVVMVFVILVLTPMAAFSWGNATHTRIAAEIGAHHGRLNYDEMYGAVLPDAFNLVFDSCGVFLADRAHHHAMAFVHTAHGCQQKAVAYGFASHNDNWGVDYTAHHDGRTTPGDGYIVLKGTQLAPLLMPDLIAILVVGGLDSATALYLATALAPELGHDLVETGVDILIKRNADPGVGARMIHAARHRPNFVPELLAEAYGHALANYAHIPLRQAKHRIQQIEREYRQQMIQYGRVMTMNEADAIQALAYQSAIIAEAYLEFYSGVDVTVDPAIVAGFIVSAIAVAEPDYAAEVSATLAYIEPQLESHGVTICGRNVPHATTALEEDNAAANLPDVFVLRQNFPNPFNPLTMINYQLPVGQWVTLKVYNTLGQEVATLVNEIQDPGYKSVQWDASGVASGVYLYRLQSGTFVDTKKLVVVK